MNVVIVGDGKVGYTLSAHLSKEGHNITVIDNRADSLRDSMNAQDVNCIEGNGVSNLTQIEAGVPKADLLIAATSADEVNILCCMVAKKLGARHTIARVRAPEYQEQMLFLKDELGLSMTVNPDLAAAGEVSRILRFPSAINVSPFARGRAEIVEIKVREGSELIGVQLTQLHRKFGVKVLVCAARRDGEVRIPMGDFVIERDDKLTIAAAPHNITEFFKSVGTFQRPVRSVIIVGGGRLAYYLTKALLASGIAVKIIERDEARCNVLCDMLPRATILCGDGTDQELLHEEGLDTTDAFVTLTGIDEENILLSMYANSCKVPKVITKVNNARFINMLGDSGLESFISPKESTAQQILRYVRAMQNATGSNVETLYRLADGKVEALEFYVRAGSRCIGKPLKELRLRKDVLVAAIIRDGACVIPGGDDVIEAEDSVIVVTVIPGLQELDHILKDE